MNSAPDSDIDEESKYAVDDVTVSIDQQYITLYLYYSHIIYIIQIGETSYNVKNETKNYQDKLDPTSIMSTSTESDATNNVS